MNEKAPWYLKVLLSDRSVVVKHFKTSVEARVAIEIMLKGGLEVWAHGIGTIYPPSQILKIHIGECMKSLLRDGSKWRPKETPCS